MFAYKPKGMSGADLAEFIESETSNFHGTVWPEWISYIANRPEAFPKNFAKAVKARRDALIGDRKAGASTWGRLARGVAVWEICLRLAAKAQIIHVTNEDIAKAIRLVWDERLQRLQKGSTPLGDRAIQSLRHCIETMANKFVPLKQYGEGPLGILGYHGMVDGRPVYLFIQSQMVKLVGDLGLQAALRELQRSGLLICKDGFMVQKRVGIEGKRTRYYAIDARILEDSE